MSRARSERTPAGLCDLDGAVSAALMTQASVPGLRHRMSLGVLSQGVSSAANLALSVVGARYLTSSEFGAFASAFVVYIVAVGLARALIGEPTLVSGDVSRETVTRVLGGTLTVALVASCVIGLIATAMAAEMRWALLALAVVLPLTLVLDALRYLSFAARRPQRALLLDAVWAATQSVAVAVVIVWHDLTPATLLVAWGASSVGGLLLAWKTAGVVRPSVRWIVQNWYLSWRYGVEWFVGAGTSYAALLLLGPIAGLGAVGGVRAAQVIFGPLNVLYSGTLAVLVPEGARMDRSRLRAALIRVSVVLTAAAVALTMAALALPRSVGDAVLGETWRSARPLIAPMGLAAASGAVMAGALAGLRSLRAAQVSLAARVCLFPPLLGLPVLGGWYAGAPGFAWANAVIAGVAAVLWWLALLRELGPEPSVTRSQ